VVEVETEITEIAPRSSKMFMLMTAYFDFFGTFKRLGPKRKNISMKFQISSMEFRLHGGFDADSIDGATHVFIDEKDPENNSKTIISELMKRPDRHRRLVHVLSYRWIADSIAAGHSLDEKLYSIL
jgi:hypothetical protein